MGNFSLELKILIKKDLKKEYEEDIIENLEWLGLVHDNKEIVRQSEKGEVYKKYLDKMIEDGSAYVSEEESPKSPGVMVKVIRFKNPNKEITFISSIF